VHEDSQGIDMRDRTDRPATEASNDCPVATADPAAQFFTFLGTPLLASGRFGSVLADGGQLEVRCKIYAEGGENATHTHLKQDHLFFVLGGQATFTIGRDAGQEIIARPFEGLLVPRGAYYRLLNSGDENLVMLRVSTGPDDPDARMGPDDAPLPGHSPKNKHEPPVFSPGRTFLPS